MAFSSGSGGGGGGDYPQAEVNYGWEEHLLQTTPHSAFILHKETRNSIDSVLVQGRNKSSTHEQVI